MRRSISLQLEARISSSLLAASKTLDRRRTTASRPSLTHDFGECSLRSQEIKSTDPLPKRQADRAGYFFFLWRKQHWIPDFFTICSPLHLTIDDWRFTCLYSKQHKTNRSEFIQRYLSCMRPTSHTYLHVHTVARPYTP